MAITDRSAVDEDRHVLSQRSPLIEHIATSCLLVPGKIGIENLPHRSPLHLSRRAGDMALEIVGEANPCHGNQKKQSEAG